MNRMFAVLVVLLLFSHSAFAQEKLTAEQTAFFESKIRPVLVEHCYRCHSAEAAKEKKLKADLYVDSRDGLRKGGESGPAVVPGKLKEGHLLAALRYDGDVKMPPKGKLPEEVVQNFAKWIAMGAPDPRDQPTANVKREIDVEAGKQYWAFRPIATPAVPKVQGSWARTDVDRFILEKLQQQKLLPNGKASAEVFLRRATFDLLGLPPTPDEVRAFTSDASPQAYDKLIDRLLGDQAYGERWGRHWLDLVRFAESGGYEFDNARPSAFHYRDFVIKALNDDMPYDEFVRLQIAGDLLQPRDYTATAATGFLVAGPYPGQTTAKTLALIRYNHLDDMVSTLGSAMLGLTLGCVRCHDHKYDPLPQGDYYRLVACLGRTDSTDAKIDPEPAIYQKAKAKWDAVHQPLLAAREKFEKEILPERLKTYWAASRKDRWHILDLDLKAKTLLKKTEEGQLLAASKGEKNDTYTFTAQTYQKGITALKLELLADPALPGSGPGLAPDGNFQLTEISVTAAPASGKGKAVPAKVKAIKATVEPGGSLAELLDPARKLGWTATGATGKDHAALFHFEEEVGSDAGTTLTVTLKFEGFGAGKPRLSLTTSPRDSSLAGPAAPQGWAELHRALALENGKVTDKNRDQVLRWSRRVDPDLARLSNLVDDHAKDEPTPNLVGVFSAQSGRGGEVHFLVRGEVERKASVAIPGFLQVLSSEREQRWLNDGKPVDPRVALARWLTDTEAGAGNLLARVIVNRLWQHHMGRGLVATTNDFGVQGDPPTHPELLNYLAAKLIQGGWKLKPLHKLIMTSAVYQQSGEVRTDAMQLDPVNRWWWRRPPQRLEAEIIRDALLAVSGTLDRRMYGAGTLEVQSPRRSIYLTVKRSQMIPMLQIFDVPEAMQSIGERSLTTVPTQSLAFMNSPFVRSRAEKLAARLAVKTPDDLPAGIDRAFQIALGRQPTEAERTRMSAFVERQAQDYGQLGRALDEFCHVLLCLNEFIYVD